MSKTNSFFIFNERASAFDAQVSAGDDACFLDRLGNQRRLADDPRLASDGHTLRMRAKLLLIVLGASAVFALFAGDGWSLRIDGIGASDGEESRMRAADSFGVFGTDKGA